MAHIVRTIEKSDYTIHLASDCYENKTPEEMEDARNGARRMAVRIMERSLRRQRETDAETEVLSVGRGGSAAGSPYIKNNMSDLDPV